MLVEEKLAYPGIDNIKLVLKRVYREVVLIRIYCDRME